MRLCGYAIDDLEEESDVRCMAVPVHDNMGRFVAALGATGTVNQITEINSLLHDLRAAADRLAGTNPAQIFFSECA